MAGLVALAFLWALSRAAPAVGFPPLALAERMVRLAPGDVATLAIERLGHAAIPTLATANVAVFLVAGALLPRILGRRTRWAAASFGALATAAVVLDPVGSASVASLAAVAGAVVLYATVLEWGIGQGAAPADLGRRRALRLLAAGAGGLVVATTVIGRLLVRRAGPDTAVSLARPEHPFTLRSRSAFPAIPGLSPELTAAADHYVVDIDIEDPVVEAVDWTLAVSGLVEEPLRLTFDALQREFDVVEEASVLTCVSNPVGGPLVGCSRWTGIRLADVLRRARPGDAAVDVVFRCADGYDVSIPVARALEQNALLAIGHEGRPLRQEHGFPCRVRAPALYGMMNAKWVEEVRLVGSDHRSHWTSRGWSDVADVRTQSRIDVPYEAALGQRSWIAGVAWAGTRGISRLEVSVDGGETWRPALLRPPAAPNAWTQWALEWVPRRRGIHRIVCRATDGDGTRQDARSRPPHPSGASGYHAVDVTVS